MTLRSGAVAKQLGTKERGVARDVTVGNPSVLQYEDQQTAIFPRYDSHLCMGARVEDLATLLALETVRVPVVSERLASLCKVDREAALLTFPHPLRCEV